MKQHIEQLVESWLQCFEDWYGQVTYPIHKMSADRDPRFFWDALAYYTSESYDKTEETWDTLKDSLSTINFIVEDIIEDIVDRVKHGG